MNIHIAGAPDFELDFYGRTNEALTPAFIGDPVAITLNAKAHKALMANKSGAAFDLAVKVLKGQLPAQEKEEKMDRDYMVLAEEPLPLRRGGPRFKSGDIRPRMETEAKGEVTGTAGVTFEETTSQREQHDHQEAVTTSELAQQAVNEHDFTFVKLLEREQLITTFQWSTSDTENETILRARVPYDFLTGQLSVPFKQFLFNHCDCIVTVKINGTPFHLGALIAWFCPLTSELEIGAHHVESRASQSVLQNMKLHANRANSAVMKITYVHFQRMLEFGDQSVDNGEFRITVWNPLLTAPTNPQTITGSLFVSFTRSKLRVLRPEAAEAEPASLQVKNRSSMRSIIIPRMLAALPNENTQETTTPVVIGVDAGEAKSVGANEQLGKIWSDIGKRGGLVRSFPEGSVGLNSYAMSSATCLLGMPAGGSGTGMPHQGYLAAPFRLYHGSMVHTLVGETEGLVAYQPGAKGVDPIRSQFLDSKASTSNAGPFDLLTESSGVTVVSTPMTTRYNALLTPRNPEDLFELRHSPGNLFVRHGAVTGHNKQFLHFMAFGDDFSLHQLYMVPNLQVPGYNLGMDTYPDPGAVVEVTAAVVVDHSGSAPPLTFVQDFFQSHDYDLNVGGPYPSIPDQMIFQTQGMTNAELRVIGIPISDTQTRNTVPGSTIIERSLAPYRAVPESLRLEWDSTGGTTGVASFDVAGDLINPTTVGGFPLGDAFILGPQSWTSTTMLQEWYGIINNEIPVADPGTNDTLRAHLRVTTVLGTKYGTVSPSPDWILLNPAP
jgi:hypothetical protein